jgi:transcriptional regulator with XRE-family HTH domain
MSQAALAQRIGFTRSSVANLEAGRQRIALHLFVRIARALSVDFVELLPTEAVMSPKDGTAILENLEERLTATPSSTKEFVRGAVAQLLPDSHEG